MTDLDGRIRVQLAAWRLNVESLRKHGMDLIALDALMQAQAAIGATLDLHKRHDEGLGYGSQEPGGYGHVPDVCGECGKIDEYAEKWPCPTVRAIAGKLGVEADG